MMDLWTSRSNPAKQTALAVGSTIVGIVMMIGFRRFSTLGGDTLAGFLCGVLLVLIGVAGLVVSGRQVVMIDPRKRLITIEDSGLLGTKKRSIPFGAVVDVRIGFLGKKSNFVSWYYLVLKLRDGEEYSLFAPGRFYEGGSDRSTVEQWRTRLEEYLREPTAGTNRGLST